MTRDSDDELAALAEQGYAALEALKRTANAARRIRDERDRADRAERVQFDDTLKSFAARAGKALDEIRALPDEPRSMPVAIDPMQGKLLGVDGMPPLFRERLLAGPLEQTGPLGDVRDWLGSPDWTLVLSGAVGCGKTLAGCYALAEGGGGLFLTAEDIASPAGGNEAAEMACEASLLLLDELGEETLFDASTARLRAVMARRQRERRRTVYTTNLNLDDTEQADTAGARRRVPGFRSRYGERLVDRIREGGRFIGYDGASLRGRL